MLPDGVLRVIKEGLSPDDRVIVNGLLRGRPGQKVTPQEQERGAASGRRRSTPQGAEEVDQKK